MEKLSFASLRIYINLLRKEVFNVFTVVEIAKKAPQSGLNSLSFLAVCGGLLNQGDHGTLSSPGYPGNYPHNRDCVWRVMVSPGMNIMFTFAVMALEHHDNCSYDYVEVMHFIRRKVFNQSYLILKERKKP